MAKKKKFRMIDAILTVICVVFVAEAAAPAAAIGNQQFFWWIFLIITFLLPYGLIVCELGTTYADDEGGIADWVRRAFGDAWGSRVSWYYWINFPLWMASLAFLFPETISMITGMEIGLVPSLAIELAFVWIVVFLSFSKVSDSAWILNLAAVLKVGIALVVGGLGIWYAVNFGFANDMAPETFLPALDSNSLTYLSIILFNFMGFEVICTFAGAMKNPSKDIPKAIVLGGLAIGAIYLFCSFGIGAAIPADQIDPDFGMIYAVMTMVGEPQNLIIAKAAGWHFGDFFLRMSPVTVPVLICGLLTCLLVEKLRWFGYGETLPEKVREVLQQFDDQSRHQRTRQDKIRLIVQAIIGVWLVTALALHLAEVGLIGFVSHYSGDIIDRCHR